MTTIPAEAVLRLREALYGELGDVAEELASVSRRPRARQQRDKWAQHLARFDRNRALLDEIGWVQRDPERDTEIDLARHRQAIVEALTAALESERHLMAEQGARAEQQRRNAHARAVTIESFMAAAGLDGDQ
jgi:hypothetical protein